MSRNTAVCLVSFVLFAAVLTPLHAAVPDTVVINYADGDNRAVAMQASSDGYLYVLGTCESEDDISSTDVVVFRIAPSGSCDRTWSYHTSVPVGESTFYYEDLAIDMALDDENDCIYVLASVGDLEDHG